ncbi:MAG: hypothetical protein H6739_28160 [Alphaproteobacteria bacterium]|nr:hypothetical protein [Alphaproteobacteria bacterium]
MTPRAAPLLIAALAAGCTSRSADSFGLSRADQPGNVLVFNNGSEPEYLDPTQATGHPDGRIIQELFDGLTEYDPVDLSATPSLAGSWDDHPDGRGYTFHLRDGARWTDDSPVTAHDFVWSWERVLNPVYLARYAQQLYTVERAQLYNRSQAAVLQVEVEGLAPGTPLELVSSNLVAPQTDLNLRDGPGGAAREEVGAGTVLLTTGRVDGGWVEVRYRADCPDLSDLPALLDCAGPEQTGWLPADSVEASFPVLNQRVLTREVELLDDDGRPLDGLDVGDEVVLLTRDGERARIFFGLRERYGWLPADALADPRGALVHYTARPLPPISWDGEPLVEPDTAAPEPDATPEEADVIPEEADAAPQEAAPVSVPLSALESHPELLGFRAVDDHTLVVRLNTIAPYFLQLTSHSTLRAAPRQAIEAYGARWTRPELIVTNGPFLLEEHKVRDRFELVKNPDWWGAQDLRLDRVIAWSVDNLTASVNLYRAGETDLVVANDLPKEFIPILQGSSDFEVSPALSVYLYRLNTRRPPLDDVRVRRALAMAIDKRDIVAVTRAGEMPASHLVPPGLPGYAGPAGPPFDPEAARALLAEAGFPGGEGFPELKILYNNLESHKLVAAVIQDQLQRHLGVTVQLENREWKTFLKSVNVGDYDISRGGWIGDYLDPTTFLDLWMTGGGNNNTGWGSAEYERLLAEANAQSDPDVRLSILAQAEAVLNEEMPFIPLYWYVWVELKQPEVGGYYPNLLDQHPLRTVWLDR